MVLLTVNVKPHRMPAKNLNKPVQYVYRILLGVVPLYMDHL